VFLSSTNFSGFTKSSDNHYRSDNYNTASKKIFMTIKSGVSSVNVSRYTATTEW
jgi:hypothetical protein